MFFDKIVFLYDIVSHKIGYLIQKIHFLDKKSTKNFVFTKKMLYLCKRTTAQLQ